MIASRQVNRCSSSSQIQSVSSIDYNWNGRLLSWDRVLFHQPAILQVFRNKL